MKRLIVLLTLILAPAASAHDPGTAAYIANEAVMVSQGETKILFDPLPLSGFGTYPEVPMDLRIQILNNKTPYDGIDAVFVSHAHRDHFDASAMNDLLGSVSHVHLVAPQQAVSMMRKDGLWQNEFTDRITAVDLDFGDAPVEVSIGDISASAVRIPHSGWPSRADVQNMVYRVSLLETATVMHMGDADINMAHYAPYESHWQDRRTDLAFPPYWIYLYRNGQDILDFMNVDRSVGIHVPIRVPDDLKVSGADFLSKTGETRTVRPLPNTK